MSDYMFLSYSQPIKRKMLFQPSDSRRSLLRTVDIFRHYLIPCLVMALVSSCATQSTKDTEGSGSITKPIPSYEVAIPDNKMPPSETAPAVDEPITDIAAPLPAERDSAPVTEPPHTNISITPDSTAPATIEPAAAELTPAEPTADQLTRTEKPKQNVVIREQPKVQKPAPSLPKQPKAEPQSKQIKEVSKRIAPRKEVNKTEKAKPEVKIETKTPDSDQAAVVAMRQEAMMDQPISPERSIDTAVERPTVTLESLPMTFGNQWTLDRAPNPISGKTECILTSESVNIFDGYEQTDVQLYLTSGAIFAKTQSNIDLSYPETGLRVDSSGLRAFEKVAKLTNAVISSDVDGVLASMVPGQQVVVRLGFWPTWPMTSTREVIFQLEGFPEALRGLQACEEM